ncbi:iron-sulfur cluster assembly protein [Nakamurella sp. PAMC28650]|uniref:iron-sulfur cluster assembly protein n=1 Tax=Nakamurella sp. PAMC28650 TaxID=2762325 RepID=UPI00164DB3C0|nr:iron-sulfur cluster assembly protein [Nakamurella sp. PAMC28650]QNK81495.1 iron-sulfur cluster assembly protein [Nakamurella sp. PAMC28650]
MTAVLSSRVHDPEAFEVRRLSAVTTALDTVIDPELDEPITDLGFVRSVQVDGGEVVVHLRLPTSFCSPNFAYLMASDAKDAIGQLDWVLRTVVQLDDHHDSDLINRGLAADAGYVGTFGHEAESDLDELRMTFRRKAHTAAMERCLTAVMRADASMTEEDLCSLTLADLAPGKFVTALRSRRADIGLPDDPRSLVFVDDQGHGYPRQDAVLRLRRARSTRISVDGNAHFCRGLLVTRYPDSGTDQAPRVHGAAPDGAAPGVPASDDPAGPSRPLIPLKVVSS